MRKSAKDLSYFERQDIYLLRSKQKGIREIARFINRDASTVSRELSRFKRRNRSFRRFWHRLSWREKAQYSHQRSIKSRGRGRTRGWRLKNEKVRQYVHQCLAEKGWSPHRISLRIKIDLPGESISHESIYQYVFDVERGLIKYLKRSSKKKKRQNRSSGKKNRAQCTKKRSIEQRPSSVDKRKDFGHSESDLIVSCKGGKACLLVFVERKTRRSYLRLVPDRKANTIRRTIFQILHLLPREARQSLTVDNGKEHEWLPQLEKTFNKDNLLVYYCNPYSAWERGTVEAINGVIREKFPKGTNFDLVSEEKVNQVEIWLNSLPMECHDGYTMAEAYEKEILALAA